MLKDFQAKPWDPKGRGEDTDVLVLPPSQEQGLPSLPVQQTDGTSAVDSSQHGLKRTSDELGGEALEEEPPNLFQRVGPAQSDLKRSAPDSVPGSETKLERTSACLKMTHFLLLVLVLRRFPPRADLTFQLSPMLTEKKNFKHFAQQNPYFGTTLSLTASKKLQE